MVMQRGKKKKDFQCDVPCFFFRICCLFIISFNVGIFLIVVCFAFLDQWGLLEIHGQKSIMKP